MKTSVIDANSVPSVSGSGKPMCRFVKDLTFPDSSEVRPGQVFEKVWLVRNDGDVLWPSNTELVFVSGDDLPATRVYPVPSSVMPGQEVPLTVQLVAPPVEGRFISYFRLHNLDTRVPFGQRLWCDYRVCANTGSFSATDCAGCKTSPERLEELPQAIADAISSVVGDDGPHEALGKLLKTWQMVQHEDETPAASMPVTTQGASPLQNAIPTTNPSVTPDNDRPDKVLVDENADDISRTDENADKNVDENVDDALSNHTLDELWDQVSQNGAKLLELQAQQRKLFKELRALKQDEAQVARARA